MAKRRPLPRALILWTALLALVVIGLGAYVRLSDAGLGCPDWPGCFGTVSPYHAAEAIDAAQALQPDGPVSPDKAWKEMLHRYLASLLGLAILAIGILAWLREHGLNRWLALALCGLVVAQGLLGMWTVTMTLRPAIVSAHLVGGMTTLAGLVWLATRLDTWPPINSVARVPLGLAALSLVLVGVQIGLGGWVSSHYAGLACSDFPTCNGVWWPQADWSNAFRLDHDLAAQANAAARVAMHWAHRIGALLVTLTVTALAWRLMGIPGMFANGSLLLGLLVFQIGLGVFNVLNHLPLLAAVAHNLVAALLLASLVQVNVRLRRRR